MKNILHSGFVVRSIPQRRQMERIKLLKTSGGASDFPIRRNPNYYYSTPVRVGGGWDFC